MNTQFAELLELPITEKLQLVEDLWDNIAATPEQVPVTDHSARSRVRHC
ncbi:MAG: addiction module protein [Hormoscilla sp. SP12CHS1]|nr:addiction module protein [Hormoscilla sp. SP12CHS1]